MRNIFPESRKSASWEQGSKLGGQGGGVIMPGTGTKEKMVKYDWPRTQVCGLRVTLSTSLENGWLLPFTRLQCGPFYWLKAAN